MLLVSHFCHARKLTSKSSFLFILSFHSVLCYLFFIKISKYTHNDLEIPDSFPHIRLRLRYDYTNLERLSPLAKQIEVVQNNCSVTKRGHYYHTNGSGLGSEIHIYSIVLCATMEMGDARFRTAGQWIYNDVEKCKASENEKPMSCYFPQAEPNCPIDATDQVEKFDIWYQARDSCPHITDMAGGHSNARAATTEYLFTRVADIVQQEGERQLNLVFGRAKRRNDPTHRNVVVPNNLITVHIRWGDKDGEMKLVPIQNYTDAVQQILDERKKKKAMRHHHVAKKATLVIDDGSDDDDDGVHIFLSTEDPEAVKQFLSVKPKEWNVYLDQYYTEMLPYRKEMGNVFNVNSFYSSHKKINGRNGLIALGSLLVAMEATDYVLTTASNWSRLINELRKNVIDPRCRNCTTMIDLLYDEL